MLVCLSVGWWRTLSACLSACVSFYLCISLVAYLPACLMLSVCLSGRSYICVCKAAGMQQESQAAAPVLQQLVFYNRHLTGRLRLSNTNRYTCDRLSRTDGLHTYRPHADIQTCRHTYSPSCRHTYSLSCRHTHRYTFSPSCSVTNI